MTTHTQEIQDKIKGMKDLGFSSRKIAKAVFGSESQKSTVNDILNRREEQRKFLRESFTRGASTFEESYENALAAHEAIKNLPGYCSAPTRGSKIMFIPDCQVRKDVDTTYLTAIGEYIVDKKPDIIVNAGDFFDFPSLSSYDKGKLSFEGRRLKDDIEAGKEGMKKLLKPLREYQKVNPSYQPRMVFCLGNHEERLKRVSSNNSEFDGFIGYHLLDLEKDWKVVDFLKPINIQGINFVHYLSNPMNGKPYGGSAAAQLKNVGCSFVVGHKQTLDVAIQPVLDGTMRIGIVAGASYPFDESYKGHQGNTHFRGVVMLYEAKDGFADPSFVSTSFLMERMKGNT